MVTNPLHVYHICTGNSLSSGTHRRSRNVAMERWIILSRLKSGSENEIVRHVAASHLCQVL